MERKELQIMRTSKGSSEPPNMTSYTWNPAKMEITYISNARTFLSITIKGEVTNPTNTKHQTLYINKLHNYPQRTKIKGLPQTPSFVINITYLF
jgi:hypothetical protein